MSSAISSVTSFFGSRTFQHLGTATSGLLNMYGLNRQHNAYNNYIQANSEQYNQAYKSFVSNSYADLTNLGLQYYEQYSVVADKGRQITGQSLAYWGNSGVEIFGSAVQNLVHNSQMIDRYKSDLYKNYLNKYSSITQQMNNAYTKDRTIQSSLSDKLKYANEGYKWGMVNDAIKLF